MFNWFGKCKVQPIGLDIGHSSIKMIQLCQGGPTIHVAAAADVPIDPTLYSDPAIRREFIISSIRRMYNQGGFNVRQTVSCLPSDIIRIRSLRLDSAAKMSRRVWVLIRRWMSFVIWWPGISFMARKSKPK